MKKKEYRTMPGWLVPPDAAKEAAVVAGTPGDKTQEALWYGHIQDWIKRGEIEVHALGTTGRVKQVNRREVTDKVRVLLGMPAEQPPRSKQMMLSMEDYLEDEQEKHIVNILDLYDSKVVDRPEVIKMLKRLPGKNGVQPKQKLTVNQMLAKYQR